MKRLVSVSRDLLLTVLILLFLGLVVTRLDAGRQELSSGHVKVVDGDTLVLDGKRIRLVGIDAPELRQICQRDNQPWPCGKGARDHLDALIGDAKTTCDAGGSDRYGRLLAVCSSGGRDLNAAMVGAGYAVAFGDYEAEQDAARAKRLGIWEGTFDAPRTWRQTHGGMEEAPHIPDGWLDAVISRLGAWLKT
ncbi:thermonuclease family protein [Pararhizobium sp. LjRoot255]|uniref:thermonuclease family protein n=1 Tax=Pararhizobium sp. LjRoot255 TaxID=3342298 RepID=UPI003ECDD337